MYRAKVGITDDAQAARYEAGEEVPADLVERAPWLLQDGHVVDLNAAPVVEEVPVEAVPSEFVTGAPVVDEAQPLADELNEDTVADEATEEA